MEPQGVEPQPQDFQSCAPTAYAKVPYLILEVHTGLEPVVTILQTVVLTNLTNAPNLVELSRFELILTGCKPIVLTIITNSPNLKQLLELSYLKLHILNITMPFSLYPKNTSFHCLLQKVTKGE